MLETIYQIALAYAVLDIVASVYVMVKYRTNLRSRMLSFISSPRTIVNTEYSDDAEMAYREGLEEGRECACEDAYNEGYHQGRNEGYDEGYEQGKEDAEESEEEMKPEMKQAMDEIFGVGV